MEGFIPLFDDLRYKSNLLTCYGNGIDFEVTKQALDNCKKLLKNYKMIIKSGTEQAASETFGRVDLC